MMRTGLAFLPHHSRQISGDSGDKCREASNGAGLQPEAKRGQSGDGLGTQRGQYWMMKFQSINLSPSLPRSRPLRGPAFRLAGFPCTSLEMGANGLPLEPFTGPGFAPRWPA